MNRLTLRPWLRLVYLLHLFNGATTLQVTYPVIGTVYPPTGPDDVQWQSTNMYVCEF